MEEPVIQECTLTLPPVFTHRKKRVSKKRLNQWRNKVGLLIATTAPELTADIPQILKDAEANPQPGGFQLTWKRRWVPART